MCESADKPGSVVDNHSSWIYVTTYLHAAYPNPVRATPWGSYLALLQMGFTMPWNVATHSGALLPHHFTLT